MNMQTSDWKTKRSQPHNTHTTMTANRSFIFGAPLTKILWHAGVVAIGTWLCSALPGNAGAEPNFLPVPGEVPAAVIRLAPKASHPAGSTALATVTQHCAQITPPSTATNDWGTYIKERGTKDVLDGKLVDKSKLTPLVGFLEDDHAVINKGSQTFAGAELEIAVRKPNVGSVAAEMTLRPGLWRRTDERVFLLDYEPATTIPGALLLVYVMEIESLEGWRTFKAGREPSFEDWQRLAGS